MCWQSAPPTTTINYNKAYLNIIRYSTIIDLKESKQYPCVLDYLIRGGSGHFNWVSGRVATKNLRRFSERLIKESIIKGEG